MGGPTTVTVKAPVRVDVAGGTLDLYPIYNILGSSLTINFGIDILSRVEIRRRNEEGIHITSGDGDSRGFSNSLSLENKGNLSVVKHVFDYFPSLGRFHLSFSSGAPSGSGLGASSSLIIALLTAVGIFSRHHVPLKKLPLVASEIESSLIHMVTGRQDYIPAIMGGLNLIRFSPGKTKLANIEKGKKECRFLEEYGFLAFTGVSHVSAKENWLLIRKFLDGTKKSRKGFESLLSLAEEALQALTGRDPEMLGDVFEREWNVRKSLSSKVSPERFEKFINRKEVKRILRGARLCGAGGGGTLFAVLKDPGERESLKELSVREGFHPIDFSVARGMEVRVGGKKVRVL